MVLQVWEVNKPTMRILCTLGIMWSNENEHPVKTIQLAKLGVCVHGHACVYIHTERDTVRHTFLHAG